jgi:hypothetical protein
MLVLRKRNEIMVIDIRFSNAEMQLKSNFMAIKWYFEFMVHDQSAAQKFQNSSIHCWRREFQPVRKSPVRERDSQSDCTFQTLPPLFRQKPEKRTT